MSAELWSALIFFSEIRAHLSGLIEQSCNSLQGNLKAEKVRKTFPLQLWILNVSRLKWPYARVAHAVDVKRKRDINKDLVERRVIFPGW